MKCLQVSIVGLILLAPMGVLAQDSSNEPNGGNVSEADHRTVDFGVRFATGDVDGRPDLPFQPGLKTSKFNEYRDVRDGFYLRRVDVRFDNVLNSGNYAWLQSQQTLYRDQSYLASFGRFGRFKIQFRYD